MEVLRSSRGLSQRSEDFTQAGVSRWHAGPSLGWQGCGPCLLSGDGHDRAVRRSAGHGPPVSLKLCLGVAFPALSVSPPNPGGLEASASLCIRETRPPPGDGIRRGWVDSPSPWVRAARAGAWAF